MAAKKTSVLVVPYTWRGSLLHWTNQDIGVDRTGESEYSGVYWRPNTPFTETLTLKGIESGRSAKYTIWRAEDGRTFPMFIAELVEMACSPAGIARGISTNRWMVAKRGQNYGIRLAREEE